MNVSSSFQFAPDGGRRQADGSAAVVGVLRPPLPARRRAGVLVSHLGLQLGPRPQPWLFQVPGSGQSPPCGPLSVSDLGQAAGVSWPGASAMCWRAGDDVEASWKSGARTI